MVKIIMSSHPDDEILGCFSLIKSGQIDFVVYFTSEDVRKKEATNFSRLFGLTPIFVGLEDTLVGIQLIEFEKEVMKKLSFIKDDDIIYIPSSADDHEDHKNVNHFIRNHFPKNELFEYSIYLCRYEYNFWKEKLRMFKVHYPSQLKYLADLKRCFTTKEAFKPVVKYTPKPDLFDREIIFIKEFCQKGNGLDMGCGHRKITKNAVGVDVVRGEKPSEWEEVPVAEFKFPFNLLPFEDNSLDFIVSSYAVEQSDNIFEIFLEWIRIIKVGGYVAVIFPDNDVIPLHPLQKSLTDRKYLKYLFSQLREIFNIKLIQFDTIRNGNSIDFVIRKESD